MIAEATEVDPTLTGKANLTKEASQYLKRFCYDTAIGNPEVLELCLKVGGADRFSLAATIPC